MNFTQRQIQVAKNLSLFASVYQNSFINREQFKKQFSDNYTSLECFLENYAYERQGSAQAYPVIAKQTIQKTFHGKLGTVSSNQSIKAWQIYEDIASSKFNGLRTNATHNPMNKNRGILSNMANRGISNIADYVRTHIKDGKAKTAHKFVDDTKGVGPKIASFYLRDITYLGGIDEDQIKDQLYLLQPLDTWLDQTFTIIMEPKKSVRLEEKQKVFVELCRQAGCSSIASNQGAWIVGSQIAGEFEKFKKIAFGEVESRQIIQNYIDEEKVFLSEIEKTCKKFELLNKPN
jgi:hypothetical protein